MPVLTVCLCLGCIFWRGAYDRIARIERFEHAHFPPAVHNRHLFQLFLHICSNSCMIGLHERDTYVPFGGNEEFRIDWRVVNDMRM